MDVSIKSADKQVREAFITAREEKQAAKDRRAEKRKNRKDRRSESVVDRRLRRRIKKKVRKDLLAEKRSYLRGEAMGEAYVISTRISYRGYIWRDSRSSVEGVLRNILAKHSGFEYKVDFDTDYGEDEWCSLIRIWYTLLEH